jgi:eukaryotic-like serine/threonine-protein kinase
VAGTIGIGELLKDRYRLERTLGRGGMAAVWLGHDERLDRPVAVKVLSDTIAGDPEFVARFRREAQIAAGLSHPNLVGVYDFSEEGERPYLVMQFVPGENLAVVLERGREVDCEQLARELLSALGHIHAVGILHRDVKPANIVVEPSGTAKLIDFGIALPPDATALTSTGLVLGTERYAAPEVMEGQAASERSDLYSCGVVLRACESQSQPLRALVAKLTSVDPRERPASAPQALALLGRDAPSAEPPTQVYRHPPRRRSRWGAVAALAACVAVLAAVAVVALGGEEDQRSPRPAPDGQRATKAKNEQPASEATQAVSPVPTAAPEPEGTDPALAASLNEEGFALIQSGDYEAAVPVLEEAVAAFPAGTEELDYAYTLFNLGNALRLSGRPEEAIPILERRLEIPNQEGAVREELSAAEAEAG